MVMIVSLCLFVCVNCFSQFLCVLLETSKILSLEVFDILLLFVIA